MTRAGAADTSTAVADEASSGVNGRHSGETLRLLDALSSRSARRTDDVAKRAGLGLDRTRAALGVLKLAGDVIELDAGWKKIEP